MVTLTPMKVSEVRRVLFEAGTGMRHYMYGGQSDFIGLNEV